MRRSFLVPLLFIVIAIVLSFSFLFSPKHRVPEQESSTSSGLAATIYPLEYITARLSQGITTVSAVVPPGVEPHDFEPKPTDVARMMRAPLVVANGAGVDGWVDALRPDITAKHRLWVYAEAVPFIPRMGEEHDEHEEEHDHGTLDPHAWLDPVRMQEATKALALELEALYPNLTLTIEENKALLLADLESLDAAYSSGLRSCKTRKVFVSHDAFGYLGKRYDLTFIPLSGISPTEEPSAGRLAEITTEAKKEGATTIFFETLVSPDIAETVAREAGLITAVLNPIEGQTEQEASEKKEYLDFMMDNLQALQKALVCA